MRLLHGEVVAGHVEEQRGDVDEAVDAIEDATVAADHLSHVLHANVALDDADREVSQLSADALGDWATVAQGASPRLVGLTLERIADLVTVLDVAGTAILQVPAAPPGMISDPVERHMVRHPITIQAQKLAVEVLNILDQHRIDDLIVVNEKNEPVGIVDSQDLTKLKLL